MNKIPIVILVIVFSSRFFSQNLTNIDVNFSVVIKNDVPVKTNSIISLGEHTSITFEVLKFYISKVELFENEKKVYSENNSFHLIEMTDMASFVLNLKLPAKVNFNSIHFHLGIDSVTNASGAMSGDLDPIKGMYWAWQSGYINFKCEGINYSKNTPLNKFQVHLGGYQTPNNSLQAVALFTANTASINVLLDLDLFIQEINLHQHYKIMSPSASAVELSKLLAKSFRIKSS